MNEKLATSDTLASCNAMINMLNFAIMHSNNQNLRDTFLTYRNQMENLQWELYVIAKSKGYYIPAAPAGQADVEAVKTAISC